MELDSFCFLTILTKFQSHLVFYILHSASSILQNTPAIKSMNLYNLLLGSKYFEILSDPLRLWGFSGIMKQINLNGKTRLKIPTGRRHTSWAIYKRGCGFELKTTQNKSSWQLIRAELELGASGLQSIALTAQPRCLLTDKDTD